MNRTVKVPACIAHYKCIDVGCDVNNCGFFYAAGISTKDRHLLIHDDVAVTLIVCHYANCVKVDLKLIELGDLVAVATDLATGTV
jgi:hypothetical protein